MAPDSDTIVVQLPEDLRTSSTLDDEMETDERHQDNPTTPIEQTTQETPSASQQATKTLKKAVNAATGPQNPNNQEKPNNQNTQNIQNTQNTQNTQQNKTSYASVAAQNNGNTWTTVSTKKKTNKKPASYYQAVLTLTQPTSHTPLQIRDLINEEFTKGGIKDPVVKEVTTSRKNNIILTTTPTYSGEYLVQHKHIWHQKFELKNVQLLESWTKVVVHNVPTEWEGAETLEILHTEIPAYNNGLQITGNPYWISREWQNKKNSSIVIAFKTAEDAARLGDSNEHHPLWDPLCPTTSQGAQPFIDWIEEQDLELLNTPGVGTFFRPHLSRETVLDLSLVTPDLASKATDWQTIPETGSDHYGLLFSIQTNADLVENPTNQPRFNTATDVNEQAERAQPIGVHSQLSGGQQLARLARIG
ncbi:hypothetical protein PTRG_01664 [Pyrenophora tritici-repentis Pt-1C-BFP]|uniref:Endonuclease/exonuclease/phosphatase domain-containing protein n=1 Tax=Pyrenophora tritici-repentis (strain Pt-1C-BFP) TaxID=426418 RepID=B2VWV2_PYRTR|nr:uncharacterized protein PTRG_01664 [Pyrenophora tritici-repentis Pt-1C-BFP]EDU41102.1 hypothetical protein PTRG_01664 [Pyrenophora tritici-repentis Pt-1C-BFP]